MAKKTEAIKSTTEPTVDFIQQLADKQKQVDEYIVTLKRLQADFENYIKRADKERLHLQTTVTAKTLSKFLNTLDDFDRASTLIANTPHAELKQGITMIHLNLQKLMQEEGIHPIVSLGQKFDPYKHEIIDIITSDKDDGVILDEIQKGYIYKEIVLRPSKVRVAKHQEKN